MTRLRRTIAACALLPLLAAAGCDEITGILWNGTLSFTYAGAGGGVFSADGEYGEGSDWATGGVHDDGMEVRAVSDRGGVRSTIRISFVGARTGPYDFGTSFAPLAAIGVFTVERDGVERAYLLRSGTVWVDDATEGGRIRGRFSGTAESPQGDVVILSGGRFDVPDLLTSSTD